MHALDSWVGADPHEEANVGNGDAWRGSSVTVGTGARMSFRSRLLGGIYGVSALVTYPPPPPTEKTVSRTVAVKVLGMGVRIL